MSEELTDEDYLNTMSVKVDAAAFSALVEAKWERYDADVSPRTLLKIRNEAFNELLAQQPRGNPDVFN
jgi:hypothetical protein